MLTRLFAMGLCTLPAFGLPVVSAEAEQDAHTLKYAPGNNYGGQVAIVVKNAPAFFGNEYDRKGYMLFDISGLSGHIWCAKLSMTVEANRANLGSPGSPYSSVGDHTIGIWVLDDGETGDGTGDWLEGDGTEPAGDAPSTDEIYWGWTGSPAYSTSDSGFDATVSARVGSIVTTITSVAHPGTAPENGDVISFESTDLIDALNADTNGLVTIMIASETVIAGDALGQGFRSTESADPPLLQIEGCQADTAPPYGELNMADVDLMISWMEVNDLRADRDGDGDADFQDVNIFISTFIEGCACSI